MTAKECAITGVYTPAIERAANNVLMKRGGSEGSMSSSSLWIDGAMCDGVLL